MLTDRDRLACLWVCEQGAMTVDQLWRAVWWSNESRSARYAYDRVGFLTKTGFLRGVRTAYSLKTYFKATHQAQAAASVLTDFERPVPLSAPKESEILHADGLTELRLAIFRAGKCAASAAAWRADRVLAMDPSFPRERFHGLIPDAIWTTPSGQRIAVEYERTRKGVKRVRAKVEAFSREMARADRAFDRVLWIGEPGVLSSLKTALGTHPSQVLRTREQFLSELAAPKAGAIHG